MARRTDTEKQAEWRKRFERFSRCGLTVARFCGGERVSVASFYHWRKKLGQTALRRRAPARPGIFRQVAVVPAPPAGVPAASRVSIQLPCGTRIEVDAEHLDAVRAVVSEVTRAHRGLETGIRSC
jgi:hypothetical protein